MARRGVRRRRRRCRTGSCVWYHRAHGSSPVPRARARQRADRATFRHAGRRRLPGVARRTARARGVRRRDAHVRRRHQRLAAPRCRSTGALLCRTHRRRAARPAGRVAHRSVRALGPRRLAVRSRRGGHEGVDRRLRDRRRGVRGRAPAPSRVDRAAAHLRRGGTGHRRHRQGGRAARRTRRTHRLVHRRGALVGGPPRRRDQERASRHAVGRAPRARRAGPRRLSGAGEEPDPPRRARDRGTGGHALGRRQRVFSADHLPMLERARRHRRHQRRPGHAGALVQLALLDREHAREPGRAPRGGAAAARSGVRARLPVVGHAVPDAAGRFIADICGEVVELGPVNATIHQINERVAVADIDRLASIYRRVLEVLLADGSP